MQTSNLETNGFLRMQYTKQKTELPPPDPSELQTSVHLGDGLLDFINTHLLTSPDEVRREFVRNMERQLVPALRFLHSNGCTHGDIKLDNIVYSDETKLFTFIDFEFSTRQGNEHVGNYMMGSWNMLPPFRAQSPIRFYAMRMRH